MLPEQLNPDPAAMRLQNLFLIFVLYAISLIVAVSWAVSAVKEDAPRVICKGVTYVQPDGSRTCEPSLKHCPRGPR